MTVTPINNKANPKSAGSISTVFTAAPQVTKPTAVRPVPL